MIVCLDRSFIYWLRTWEEGIELRTPFEISKTNINYNS